MKRLLVVFAFLTGMVLFPKVVSKSYAEQWSRWMVTASSQMVTTGYGKLRKIELSSGTGADWLIAIDSAVPSNTVYSSFPSTQAITPALIFTTYYSTSGANYIPTTWEIGPGEYTSFYNGLYIFKSAASSGEANKAVIWWSR